MSKVKDATLLLPLLEEGVNILVRMGRENDASL
jgi:hypothetical protein